MKWTLVLTKFTKNNQNVFVFVYFTDLLSFQIQKVVKLAYSLKPLPLYKIRITSEMIENIMDLIALILSKIRG